MDKNEFLNKQVEELEQITSEKALELVSELDSNVNWNQTEENMKRYANWTGGC